VASGTDNPGGGEGVVDIASYLSIGLLAPCVTSSHVVHVTCLPALSAQIMALNIAKAGARYWG
jgi:hypothetical protein